MEVTDGRILKFLETRFKAGDITANEAGQALVVAFNHLSAEPVSVALAQVSWQHSLTPNSSNIEAW